MAEQWFHSRLWSWTFEENNFFPNFCSVSFFIQPVPWWNHDIISNLIIYNHAPVFSLSKKSYGHWLWGQCPSLEWIFLVEYILNCLDYIGTWWNKLYRHWKEGERSRKIGFLQWEARCWYSFILWRGQYNWCNWSY